MRLSNNNRIYLCCECGKRADFYADSHDAAFCANACFTSFREKQRCVPNLSLAEILTKTTQFRSIQYTDENLQLVTMHLKVGEKIGDEKDANKPEIHPNATQVMIAFRGEARVTIFKDGQPYAFEISGSGDGKSMAIIPPNTYHLVEAIGPNELTLLLVYSPPVH